MRMAPRKPVNDRSISSLKKRALRRTKTLRRDPETHEVIRPSKFSQTMTSLKAPFTRQYWEDAFEGSDDETLVDGKLLSYAYLEAGMIEFAGACVLSRWGPSRLLLIFSSSLRADWQRTSSSSSRTASPREIFAGRRQLSTRPRPSVRASIFCQGLRGINAMRP